MADDLIYGVDVDLRKALDKLKTLDAAFARIAQVNRQAATISVGAADQAAQAHVKGAERAAGAAEASARRREKADEGAARKAEQAAKRLESQQLKQEGAQGRFFLGNIFSSILGLGQKADDQIQGIFRVTGDNVRQLGFSLERFGIRGSAAFGEIFAAAGALGIGIGGVLLTVNLLSKAFVALAQAGVAAFKELIAQSVQVNESFQITRQQFLGVFKGNEAAAQSSFDFIRRLSRELGTDVSEVARSFIPEVGSLRQLEDVVKIAASLARFQPEQGATGARIALQEALSGNLQSLQRRFEISPVAIDRIKELQKEFGLVDGLIQGLNEEFERTGRTLEDLGVASQVQLGRVKEIIRDIQDRLGEPINVQLGEEFREIGDALEEREDQIAQIATAIGTAVSQVADVVGDLAVKLIEGLDSEAAQEFSEQILQIGAGLKAIIELLGLVDFGEGVSPGLLIIQQINKELERAVGWLLLLKTNAAIAGEALAQSLNVLIALQQAASGNILAAQDTLANAAGAITIAGIESAQESLAVIEDYKAALEGAEELAESFSGANEEMGQSGDRAANAILAENLALREQADDLEELKDAANEAAEARRKVKEARLDFQIDKERAAMDLQRKEQRALIDLEIEISQKRADLARKNAQEIEDIGRKHLQRIADQRRNFAQQEQDILRRFAREEIDSAKEEADRRAEIEEDFQRKLEAIRRRFDFQAREAIRDNNAIAFLRIQRQKDFELNEARLERDDEIDDAVQQAQERRQKINEQLQLELEDARIANARKLEELQIQLQRELQEQAIKHQREVQELAIQEQRKREELARSFARQREDFNIYWARRLQDLERNLQRELEIIRRYELLKARARLESRQASGPGNRGGNRNGRNDDDEESTTTVNGQPVPRPRSRDAGGAVISGQPYRIGRPEIFIPNRGGTIFPLGGANLSMLTKLPQMQQQIDQSRHNTLKLDLLDTAALSKKMKEELKSLVFELFNQMK